MMYQLRKQPFLMSSRNAPRVTTLKTAARETIGREVRIRKVRDRPCAAIFFLFNRNTLNNRSKIKFLNRFLFSEGKKYGLVAMSI